MTANSLEKRRKLMEAILSNEDLLREVLLRVPTKSLLRFKCVSKYWLSIITDPKFCSDHARMNPTSPVSGIYFRYSTRRQRGHEPVKFFSLSRANQSLPTLAFLENALPNSKLEILHACNGLSLFSYGYGEPYVVCNLSTQKFTLLPQHLGLSCFQYQEKYAAYLAFDPSKSSHYKVVLVGWLKGGIPYIYNDNEQEYNDEYNGSSYEIDIYSSETGSWKRRIFPAPHGRYVKYMASWNGAIHWLTREKFHVRFEVDAEKLVASPMFPKPKILDNEKIRYFGECCGHLFLIKIRSRSADGFDILEMDGDYCGWALKCRVDMGPLITSFPESFQPPDLVGCWKFSVLCVVKEEGEFALLLATRGKIILYGVQRKTFKVLHEIPSQEFPKNPYVYNYAYAYPFVETLSPV